MHSIKNISGRNKIDTQSRADAYIRRKRLICKSDYNLKSGDAPKSILETEKTLKTLSSGQIYLKNSKNTKKTTGLGFLKKFGFFPTLAEGSAAGAVPTAGGAELRLPAPSHPG
jgi:hypothetical protein